MLSGKILKMSYMLEIKWLGKFSKFSCSLIKFKNIIILIYLKIKYNINIINIISK
jgi:hypothetical protein